MGKITGIKSVAAETKKLHPGCRCHVHAVVDKTTGKVLCGCLDVNSFDRIGNG